MAGRRIAGASQRRGDARDGASYELDKFRAQLIESLTSTISDTVDTVCEEFEESLSQAVQSAPPTKSGTRSSRSSASNGDGVAVANDYDLYYSCCQRLVAYICENMETAPDFAQQMDRIILACHSNASERVLRSVVTKTLWFHRREDKQEVEEDKENGVQSSDDNDSDVKYEPKQPRRAASTRATPQRGTKRSAPPIRRRSEPKPQPPKRARREAAARRTSYAESDDDDVDDETAPVQKRATKRRQNRIKYSDDEEEETKNGNGDEDDDDDVEFVKEEAASQPHYGQADELLNFKDHIGDMCYADDRTTAQTRFFKERLRKAIEFVDAQLCKPPKGKSCSWDCAKIRRQMCNRDLPCRNKICQQWHDVEVHTDRCQNTHCEFRIRVMLRETMHKIDHKKIDLQDYRNELHTKKKKLLELKHENLSDRDSYVERRLLDNEIGQLEADIDAAEKEIGVYKATKKAYWATLNEIGLTEEDDVTDKFPDFNAHYQVKKSAAAAKKKSPLKKQTDADDEGSRPRAARQRRRQSTPSPSSSRPHPLPARERITRRSTQQSLRAMTSGIIELDDDDDEDEVNEHEEAKTDRSGDEQEANPSERSVDEHDVNHDGRDEEEDATEEPDAAAASTEAEEVEEGQPEPTERYEEEGQHEDVHPEEESQNDYQEEYVDQAGVEDADEEAPVPEPIAEEHEATHDEEREQSQAYSDEANEEQSADYVLESEEPDTQAPQHAAVESGEDTGPVLPF